MARTLLIREKDSIFAYIGIISNNKKKLMTSIDKGVIIVAGGSGTRMGAAKPKQFLELRGREILLWSVLAFREALPDAKIVIVLPDAEKNVWNKIADREGIAGYCEVCAGGATRSESVLNGLRNLSSEVEIAGIHDGVRPLVSVDMIHRLYAEAEEYGTAIPVVEAIDSFRIYDASGELKTIDRNLLRAVQTPQVFQTRLLRAAFESTLQEDLANFTDDASLVEHYGTRLHFTAGDAANIKITWSDDIPIAEALIDRRKN